MGLGLDTPPPDCDRCNVRMGAVGSGVDSNGCHDTWRCPKCQQRVERRFDDAGNLI